MPQTIAFLRAINVGRRTVKMETLRGLFSAAGLSGVATFINSGNVIFDTPPEDAELLALRLEELLAEGLGYAVPVMLRAAEHLESIIAAAPFTPQAEETLYVSFLRRVPTPDAVAQLAAAKGPMDELQVNGRELFRLYRRHLGESKLSNARIERMLGVAATNRNMNTVRRLAGKFGA